MSGQKFDILKATELSKTSNFDFLAFNIVDFFSVKFRFADIGSTGTQEPH